MTTNTIDAAAAEKAIPTRPMTGAEYLESLRDGREIWIYGERVPDVTTHPAFRNTARMIARLYDALHDPALKEVLTTATDTGSGGHTHRYFRAPMSWEEQLAGRDAIVAHHGLIPLQDRRDACVFMVPMHAPGVKLISRASYENTAAVMGTPFDYPLSSRLDENDAIFVLENTFIPWEDVFVYGDIEAANNFFPKTGFVPRALLHGCTRLAVKLEFIAGLMLQALEATGTRDYRGQQVRAGEVIAYRNLFWSLSEAMARNATPWVNGAVLPNLEAASAYHVFGATFYPIVKNLIEQSVTSGLIYLNSSARDFQNPELRPYLDKYVRGSGGYDAESRVKLMKLLWDATGLTDRMRELVQACLAEYDLNGWTASDLINPDDISWLPKR